jgi:hypothetical protein
MTPGGQSCRGRLLCPNLRRCQSIPVSPETGTCRKEVAMNEREQILDALMQVIGEEGCGVSCEEATIFKDEQGWKMMLEGFMEPWKLGQTMAEAKASIKQYAAMGFGLS